MKQLLIKECFASQGYPRATRPLWMRLPVDQAINATSKITPAEISTLLETRLFQPKKRNTAGQLVSPAQYETTRTQTITKPRSVTKIDAVCPEDLTPEFVASLQRAFQARGLFFSKITGSMDTPTRRAILNFQIVRGVESATVMKATAQELGLVVIDQ